MFSSPQLSWKCKLATVKSLKVDISSASPSSEQSLKKEHFFCFEFKTPLSKRKISLKKLELRQD